MQSSTTNLSSLDVLNAKILLVDDDKINTAILARSLRMFEHIYEVHSGVDAIEFCKETPPDLVILDVVMPSMDGYATCKILKSMPEMGNCPIIFSTTLETVEDEIACWEAGGADFVAKPAIPQTLIKRIQAHLQLKLKSDAQNELAYFDGLTGLGNRRYYNNIYKEQLALALRTQKDLAIVVLDLDYFKQYNDKYGHQQGDQCLINIAQTIKSQILRPTDSAMRYGGEEFVLILPDTDINGAKLVANKIISAVMAQKTPHICSPHHIVTISAGVASLRTLPTNEELFTIADKKLYEAKKLGRNACA